MPSGSSLNADRLGTLFIIRNARSSPLHLRAKRDHQQFMLLGNPTLQLQEGDLSPHLQKLSP